MPEEPTASDLVELVRRYVEATGSGDYDSMMSFYASDAVWDLAAAGLGTLEGSVAIRGFYEDWGGSFEGLEVELQEVDELGHGVVLVVNRLKGRPVGGTRDVELQQAWVLGWLDGMVVRQMSYLDIDEARAAAERLAAEQQ